MNPLGSMKAPLYIDDKGYTEDDTYYYIGDKTYNKDWYTPVYVLPINDDPQRAVEPRGEELVTAE